jgi:tetratricopeptide (TPR) repeat protein
VADDEFAAGLALRTGFVRRDLGDFPAAQARFRRARTLFEQAGQRSGLSQALALDGWVTLRLGRPSEAAELARASLALAEGPARITGLVTLGVALAPDEPAEALAALHEALRLAEAPHNKAWCHNYLGVALRVSGRPDEALDHHRQAVELLEPLAEVQLELEVLPAFAETCRAAGRHHEAQALEERAAELAAGLGRPPRAGVPAGDRGTGSGSRS